MALLTHVLIEFDYGCHGLWPGNGRSIGGVLLAIPMLQPARESATRVAAIASLRMA
jgi:hypothetical protein